MATHRTQSVKVLALQRQSLVADGVPSLSVTARVTEVLDYLEYLGKVEYASISENDPCASLALVWADVLILSKHNSLAALGLAQLARSKGLRVIYDIDDWIFSFPTYSGGRAVKNPSFAQEIIALANVVTVANAELLKRLPHVMPEAKPILMPNGMWVERYCRPDVVTQEATAPRVLFTNADFLKVQSARDGILSALHVFFARHPGYVLDFFGDPFPEMFSLPFLHFTNRMPYENYMHAIVAGNYQFSITPLGAEEDKESADFNTCKNPFKYINYGTARIPGIYSKADIYNTCIQHGQTGLLVGNDFEKWLDILELMACDFDLRERIRRQAYNDVMENFHVRKSAEVLEEAINGLP